MLIPPRCEIIKFCHTDIKDESIVLSDQLCDGVFVAGILVKPDDCNRIPVKILNIRNEAVNLKNFVPKVEKLDNYNLEELLAKKTLRKDYQEFVSLGCDKIVANKSRSPINTPLFVEDGNVPIVQKCIIPELHILQGFVNNLFWIVLVPLLGKEKALLWPQKLKLVSKNYHGEAFEGNACRTLLKRADVLLEPEISEHLGGFLALQPFIADFRAMDKIVHSCFAVRRVKSELSHHN
ncbi:unnamed protein product [Psylliodes chrysocephalus]|uniref:Uncharacterized protein n=1 Tax=Psylliodes chrysocephalus TaxID=3402493 RepID=A0A9P0D3L8_9CUCU|nr:unnamed protein product [Psylliodes chrysocephala]